MKTKETVRDINGIMLKGCAARAKWAVYIDGLLNVVKDRRAKICAVEAVNVPMMKEEKVSHIYINKMCHAVRETRIKCRLKYLEREKK